MGLTQTNGKNNMNAS